MWIFCKRNDLYFRIEIEKNDWIVVKIERIESYRLWSRQLLQRKANLKSSSLVSMQLSCRSLSSQTWCRGFSAIQCSDLLQLPCRQNQVVKFPFRWKCPSKFAKTNSHRLQFCVSFWVCILSIRRWGRRDTGKQDSPKIKRWEPGFSFVLESISWPEGRKLCPVQELFFCE